MSFHLSDNVNNNSKATDYGVCEMRDVEVLRCLENILHMIAKIYLLLYNCSSDHDADTSRVPFVQDPNQSYSIVDGTVPVYRSSEDSSDEHSSSHDTHSDYDLSENDEDDRCLW